MMVTLTDALILTAGLIIFSLVSYYWKIKVFSYFRLIRVVVVMVLAPIYILVLGSDLSSTVTLLAILGIEILGILYLGYQYEDQIALPYKRMYAAMVRASDNKNLDISSALNTDISGEMKRLQNKQVEFVNDMTRLMTSISQQRSNILGYVDTMNKRTDRMQDEVSNVTDDVDKILQNASVISEQVEELRNSGLNFIDRTDSEFNHLVEIANMSNRITDQTNIIAVNAAIEAAHSEDQGNFGTVADGIQSISRRSRETTDKLSQSISQLRRNILKEITELNQGLDKLEDAIFEMGELANRSSSFAHQQLNFISEVKGISSQVERSNSSISEILNTYQIE